MDQLYRDHDAGELIQQLIDEHGVRLLMIRCSSLAYCDKYTYTRKQNKNIYLIENEINIFLVIRSYMIPITILKMMN